MDLQHRVAFLQAQLSCRLGQVTRLKTQVKALESELTSLKASLSLGPNPVSVSSKAADSVAADSVAANPIAEGTTPSRSPASAPAQDLHRPLPGQHHEPTPPAPGFVGNYALWDLRPVGADGSGTALRSSGQGECGAVPPETTVQAERSPSPTQAPKHAANSSPGAPDDAQVGPSADPTPTHTTSGETSSAIVAEQAKNPSSCVSTTPTVSKPSATSRHPLHDFWVDNRDNSPPARNTRNRDLRGEQLAFES